MKAPSFATACLLFLCCHLAGAESLQGALYRPVNGYVPDAKTAIQIAVAVWSPIYGEKMIQNEKPFHAQLNHGIWIVTGSLPRSTRYGGVALAEISKKDGSILRIIHGK